MAEFGFALLAGFLGLLSKAGFWYCLVALGCANTLATGMKSAARHLAIAAIIFTDRSPREVRRLLRKMKQVDEVDGLPPFSRVVRAREIKEIVDANPDL